MSNWHHLAFTYTDPLSQPTVMVRSDHYIHMFSVRPSQFYKISQNIRISRENLGLAEWIIDLYCN